MRRTAPCRTSKKARHPRRKRHQRSKVQQRLATLIGTKFCEHFLRHGIINGQRKKRAKDHIGGRMAHLRLDLDRRICCAGKTGGGPFGSGPHGAKAVMQAPPLKCGINDPPLPAPSCTVGDKNGASQQRAQTFIDAVRFGKIFRLFFQDHVHQPGIIDQKRAKERCAEHSHPCTI